MKRNDFVKLKHQSVSELEKQLSDLQKDLVTARLSARTTDVKDVHHYAKLRRMIARVKTLITQKSSGQTPPDEVKSNASAPTTKSPRTPAKSTKSTSKKEVK